MAYHWTVYSFGENSYRGNSEFDNFSLERSHTTFGLFLSVVLATTRHSTVRVVPRSLRSLAWCGQKAQKYLHAYI